MKAQEICLGVVMLTLSVLNNNIITAVELQMDSKVENFYLNISEQSQQNDKHKRKSDLRQLSYLKLMNLKTIHVPKQQSYLSKLVRMHVSQE